MTTDNIHRTLKRYGQHYLTTLRLAYALAVPAWWLALSYTVAICATRYAYVVAGRSDYQIEVFWSNLQNAELFFSAAMLSTAGFLIYGRVVVQLLVLLVMQYMLLFGMIKQVFSPNGISVWRDTDLLLALRYSCGTFVRSELPVWSFIILSMAAITRLIIMGVSQLRLPPQEMPERLV